METVLVASLGMIVGVAVFLLGVWVGRLTAPARQVQVSRGNDVTQIQSAIGGVGVSRFTHGRASVRAQVGDVDLARTEVMRPIRREL